MSNSNVVEGNGFRLYAEQKISAFRRALKINDIEVDPGVEKIEFTGAREIDLMRVMKQFPDVKTIEISTPINDIEISNFMFPNVETVISHSSYFRSGPCLMRNNVLKNTFCKKPGTILDLSCVTTISEYALEGCMADIGKIYPKPYLNKESFLGYRKLIGREATDGVVQIGGCIAAFIGDDFLIPETASSVARNLTVQTGATVHVKGEKALDLVERYFKNCRRYTLSLEIPNSCDASAAIEKYSRGNFTNTELYISENPFCMVVDGILFSKDMTDLISYPKRTKGEVVVPEGVERISFQAFKGCVGITKISLPKSVREIDAFAFSDCRSLKEVVWEDGIEEIGNSAFAGCESLKEILFPKTVRKIGECAFGECVNLFSISLNEGLEEIGENAFWDSSLLKKISIPGSLGKIGKNAFRCLEKLELKGKRIPYGLINAISRDPVYGLPEMQEFSVVECSLSSGRKFFVPFYIKLEVAEKQDKTLRFFRDNAEILDTLYKIAACTDAKQECAVRVYRETGREELQAYLRRSSKNIVEMYVQNGMQDALVEFLKLGLVSETALKTVVKKADDMPAAKAYVLSMMKDPKTFRL